jgi:hypothetical protein
MDPETQALAAMMSQQAGMPQQAQPNGMNVQEGPEHEQAEGEPPEDILQELQSISAELQGIAPRLAQRLTAVTQIIFGD